MRGCAGARCGGPEVRRRRAALRCELARDGVFQELDLARLERVLRSENHQAVPLNQVFENLGAVSKMIHGDPNIRAHGGLDQGGAIVAKLGAEK